MDSENNENVCCLGPQTAWGIRSRGSGQCTDWSQRSEEKGAVSWCHSMDWGGELDVSISEEGEHGTQLRLIMNWGWGRMLKLFYWTEVIWIFKLKEQSYNTICLKLGLQLLESRHFQFCSVKMASVLGTEWIPNSSSRLEGLRDVSFHLPTPLHPPVTLQPKGTVTHPRGHQAMLRTAEALQPTVRTQTVSLAREW